MDLHTQFGRQLLWSMQLYKNLEDKTGILYRMQVNKNGDLRNF
jgi:hypothetical protein